MNRRMRSIRGVYAGRKKMQVSLKDDMERKPMISMYLRNKEFNERLHKWSKKDGMEN